MPAGETQAIRFHINGKEHVVSKILPATTSLNDYIREQACLPGTKVMCREAGCGCCSVAVTHASPGDDTMETHSVPSCLTPLYSVDGWQISTVEGIGNQKDGFHPIQDRIAKYNGSQCGYCTPGMVMNMYGLLHQNPELTKQEIEDSFDGNICRCTGYRPILDAMKSFAVDSDTPNVKAIDIEDLNKHLCPKTGEACTNDNGGKRCLNLELGDAKWFRPTSLLATDDIFNAHKKSSIRLVYGNTAHGIYKNDGPFDVYVDLHGIKDIFSSDGKTSQIKLFGNQESGLTIGAGNSLTKLINRLQSHQDKPGFGYFSNLVKHFKVVANVMVRNCGSIAGNLMIKHNHPEFPSDLFTTFEAAGATVQVYGQSKFSTHKLKDFLNMDMHGKVLIAVHFPKHENNEVFRSFKVTPRWQNAHAYVNAAFRMMVDGQTILDKPSIVYGGINAHTVHAEETEAFLKGKTLNKDVVKEALSILKQELNPDEDQLLASPKYRKDLACSLLYKVLLGVCRPNNAKLLSGPDNLYRPISSGLQTYQEMKAEFPLKQPLPKKTSHLQAAGEAVYVNDMPKYQNELFLALVQAEEANATLGSVDASEALKMPGVVGYIDGNDIPEGGDNNTMTSGPFTLQPEELFATKEIRYNGQVVGAILAESRNEAFAALSKVKINYTEKRKPLLTLDESIAAGNEVPFPMKEFLVGNPDEAMNSPDNKIITGEVRMGSQTHFFMETHITLAAPSEDGIDVYCSSQYPDMSQAVAAGIIAKPLNYINVYVPRIGGGFGGKIFDCCPSNAAATLGAYLTGRPVRVAYSLANVMTTGGKRPPLLVKYKAAVDGSGKVQAIEMEYYLDIGSMPTAAMDLFHHMQYIDMGYWVPNWKIHPHAMTTNKARVSPVRAPGSVPAALVIESIMEHAAKSCNIHPIRLKEINLIDKHHTDLHGHAMKDCTIRECWQRLKDLAEVEGRIRQVDAFNQENLWKKRGITMTTSKYGINYYGSGHNAQVSIFHRDGSVVVSQGGTEMGQGLYMKVAQAVAQVLEIPLDSIKVRSTQSIISPNTRPSGGSTASELAVQSATEASKILKERIRPIKEKFPDLDWKKLVEKCERMMVDLSAKYQHFPPPGNPVFNYHVYCVAAIESEVDVLTGESQIRRVDIMADFGESLNPTIDIGQMEGGFVMGLGAFLSEDVIIDGQTGRLLNDGTWEYKPPTTKDIPIDWRIHLLPDRPNPNGIHSSKAVGEPPISLSCGALFANKLAVEAARKDLFGAEDYVPPVAPYTVERVQQSVGLGLEHLTF